MSVSRYLAELARKDLVSDWPDGYFERLFSNDDIAPMTRASEGDFEVRMPFE